MKVLRADRISRDSYRNRELGIVNVIV